MYTHTHASVYTFTIDEYEMNTCFHKNRGPRIEKLNSENWDDSHQAPQKYNKNIFLNWAMSFVVYKVKGQSLCAV